MLSQLLKAIQNAEQPLSLMQLSRLTGVQEGALQGMLALCVRKGYLIIEDQSGCSDGCNFCPVTKANKKQCAAKSNPPVIYRLKR